MSFLKVNKTISFFNSSQDLNLDLFGCNYCKQPTVLSTEKIFSCKLIKNDNCLGYKPNNAPFFLKCAQKLHSCTILVGCGLWDMP